MPIYYLTLNHNKVGSKCRYADLLRSSAVELILAEFNRRIPSIKCGSFRYRTCLIPALISIFAHWEQGGMECCLNHCVLLGMDTDTGLLSLSGLKFSAFALGAPITATFIAVWYPMGSSVISCCDDSFILYQNSANASSYAIRSRCHYISKLHKVRIPVWSFHSAHVAHCIKMLVE